MRERCGIINLSFYRVIVTIQVTNVILRELATEESRLFFTTCFITRDSSLPNPFPRSE